MEPLNLEINLYIEASSAFSGMLLEDTLHKSND